MNSANYCFSINSYKQGIHALDICKKENILPILYIKYHLIDCLGVEWLLELQRMIKKNKLSKNLEMYVDVMKNYGLFITLVEKKIKFIKLEAEDKILKRLEEIALLNKVLINPGFSIIDLSKSKRFIS